MKLNIVFMGSPDFALPTLSALAQNHHVAGVVTQPDRAAGRGRALKAPPVKELAQKLNIPVIQPEKLKQPEALEQLRAWQPDLIVVAAFGQILKPEVLNLPRYGCLNVHASLLPRWRGAAPINAAILAGDSETGVTLMKMDIGLDTGDMLARKTLPIAAEDTAGTLFGALAKLGADLLLETLPAYIGGKLAAQPQDNALATYAPMLKKEDGLLDFSKSASELERRIRAMNPWPGAWMLWKDAPLKVLRATVADGGESAHAAQRLTVQENPAIQCGEGILILQEIQPAGKKTMSGKSFLAGARNWVE
ncbi:MAG: methionyl-tRNA formyltransferase [Anaerolineales bacterium]